MSGFELRSNLGGVECVEDGAVRSSHSHLHRDAFCALWTKRAAHVETRKAVALEQYSAWHAAQAAYVDCMHRWDGGREGEGESSLLQPFSSCVGVSSNVCVRVL